MKRLFPFLLLPTSPRSDLPSRSLRRPAIVEPLEHRIAPATFTWDAGGGADTNWFNPLNWDLDLGVPGESDTAILDSGLTINLPSDTSIGVFQQSNGTFTSPGGVTFTVLTNFAWSGGTMGGSGTTTIAAEATLAVSGGAQKSLGDGGNTGRVLINNGTATLSGGTLFINPSGGANPGAQFLNNAVFNASDNADLALIGFGGGLPAFNNSAGATFNKSGAGTTTAILVAFNNAGTVNVDAGRLDLNEGGASSGGFAVDAGAVLGFGGGTHTLDAASNVSGAGEIAFSGGTTSLAGVYNVSSTTVSGGTANFNQAGATTSVLALSSGTLAGTGGFTVGTSAAWSGGTMGGSGTTTIAAEATLAVSGGAQKSLGDGGNTGRVLINNGTATLSGGTLFINPSGGANPGAQFLNNAVFNASDNADLALMGFGGGLPAFINSANATFNKSGAGTTTAILVAFNNAGTVNVDAGRLDLNEGGASSGGFAVDAGAVLGFGGGTHTLDAASNVSGAGEIAFSGGTTSLAGVYNVSSTTVSGGTANFNQAGATTSVLALSSGTLAGTGGFTVGTSAAWSGGTMGGSGTTTIAAEATLAVSGGAQKSLGDGGNTGRVLINNGTATLSGGTLFINPSGGANPGAQFLNNAVFNASDNADLALMGFGGGLPAFINSANATFNKSGAGTTTAILVAFNNAGTVNVDAGRLDLNEGGASSGGFAVDAGAVLGFGGGTHTLDAASNVSGAGEIAFSGGTTSLAGVYNVSSTTVSGGTANFNQAGATTSVLALSSGTLAGTGGFTVGTSAAWSGGTMGGSGTTTIAAEATLAVSGGAQKSLGDGGNTGRVLINNGTATLSGGTLFINPSGGANPGAQFLNNAVFNASDNADLALMGFGGGLPAFINSAGATFNKSGAGTTTAILVAFNNAGTVNVDAGRLDLNEGGASSGGFAVDAGAVLGFGGGTHTLDAASNVSGAGEIAFSGGTTSLAGVYNVSSTTVSGGTANFNQAGATTSVLALSSGTLAGTGGFTVGTSAAWSGGTMGGSGTTTIAAEATLAVSGGAQKSLGDGGNTGRVLINNGTATLSGGTLFINPSGGANPGAQFLNNAVFNASDNADLALMGFGGGLPAFINSAGATFNKSGAGTTTAILVAFNNAGTVNVDAGRLDLNEGGASSGGFAVDAGAVLGFGGGTHTLDAASNVSGAGEIAFSGGTTSLAGVYNVSSTTVSGGTANFNQAGATTSVLALSSGTLAGTGGFTVGTSAAWSGGTMGGSGTTTIAAEATLAVSGGAQKSLGDGGNTGRVLINNGTATLSGGTLFINPSGGANPGAQFLNNAVFNASDNADLALMGFGGGLPAFINSANATFNKSGAGTTTAILVAFNNAGTVNVLNGNLNFSNFAQSAGTTVLAGGTIGGNTTLVFQGGELRGEGTIAGSVNNAGATVRPGGTGVAGTLTINGGYTQGAGGTFDVEVGGTGAGQFDALTASTTATIGGTLNTALINGFTPAGGAQFQVLTGDARSGTFATVTGPLTAQYNPANVTLLAAASTTFVWDAGGGADTSWFNALNWDRDSGVPGAGDTAILNTNATISLDGTNATVANFTQNDGTFLGGATLTITDTFSFGKGTLGGTGSTVVNAGGAFAFNDIGPIDAKILDGRTLSLLGAGNVTGNDDLTMNNGARLIVSSSFTTGNLFDILHTTGPNAQVVVTSTGSWVNNDVTNIASGVLFDSSGPISLPNASGALNLQGGGTFSGGTIALTGNLTNLRLQSDFTFLANTTFTGVGTIHTQNGTTTIPAAVSLSGVGTANYALDGGTITGGGSISFAGKMDWNAGTLRNVTATFNGASSLVDGPGAKTLDNASLTFTSTVVDSAGNITLLNGASINISAGYEIRSGHDFVAGAGGGFFNVLTGGDLTTNLSNDPIVFSPGILLNNSGSVTATTGNIDIQGGSSGSGGTWRTLLGNNIIFNTGTHAFSGSTTFTEGAGGEHQIGSGAVVNLNGPTILANNAVLRANGGTLNVNGTMDVSAAATLALTTGAVGGAAGIIVNGTLDWSAGTLAPGGGTTVNASGNVLLGPVPAGSRTLAQDFDNGGSAIITGPLTITNGASFRNSGTLDFQADTVWVRTGGPALLNSGTLLKSGGAGDSSFGGALAVANNGTVEVRAGRFDFPVGFTQTAGTTFLNGGGLSGGTMDFQGGVFVGTGAVAGSVNNSGAIIRPGGTGATGTLTITGGYTQSAGGTLAVEVGGTSAGQFDVLSVSGNIALDGTLNASLINGFAPASGATFQILTAAARSGTFATTNLPPGFTVQNNANNVTLLAPAATVFTWDGSDSTDWFDPDNWTPTGVPGVSDTAILDSRLAAAQLTLTGQFNPAVGSLIGAGFDAPQDRIWLYDGFGTLIRSFSRSGEPLSTIPRPGGASDDGDIEFAPEALTLGGTLVPAGTLLFIDGENGPAEIYAVDKNTGAVLATLATTFGASHVVGGGYHSGRNTFFLVTDRNDATPNRIAEIDAVTGAVLNSFGTSGYDVNFGDLDVSAATGNLVLVSSVESSIQELTRDGVLVQNRALPPGVSSLSGLAFDDFNGELLLSSTNGNVYRVAGFAGAAPNLPVLGADTTIAVLQQSALTLSGAGTLTVTSAFAWSGGVQSGTGTTSLPAGSLSTLSGAALKTLSGRALNVGGTLTWTGAGNIALNEGTLTVQNGGTFDIQNDALLGDADGNGTAAAFVIAGTLKKSAGIATSAIGGNLETGAGIVPVTVSGSGIVRAESGTLQFDGGLNNGGLVNALGNTIILATGSGTSNGVFNADANGAVRVTGGIQTLTAGASITGVGRFDIVNGRVDIESLASVNATNVALGGATGALVISGAMTISQSFDWTGGTIGGGASLTLAAGSNSVINGAEVKSLTSGTISTGGTLTWLGTGALNVGGGGQLRVLAGGLFDLQSDAPLTNSLGGLNASLIIDGTLRKSAGAGTSRIDGSNGMVNTTINTTGRVEVQSGTLVFGDNFANEGTVNALAGTIEIAGPANNDGTFNAATGARVLFSSGALMVFTGTAFTGGGLFEITGSGFVLNTSVTVPNLALNSSFGGISGAGNLTITQSLNWTAGSMSGAGTTTLSESSVSTMSGSVDKVLTRDLDLFGTLTIDNSGSTVFAINSGTLRVRPGALLDLNFVAIVDNDSGTPGNLVVDGTLRKSGVNDIASIGGRTFGTGSVNTTINAGGRVEVTGGPLDFRGNGANNSAGVFDIVAFGNTDLTFNVPFTLNAGAAFTGAGTSIIANNATLTIAAPVNASGTLKLVNGTLALAAPLTQTGMFEFSGGTLSGAGNLTITSTGLWSGGTMAGTGTTTVASGATLTITDAAAKTLSRALNNAGTVTTTGSAGLGGVTTTATGSITNSGLFNFASDLRFTGTSPGLFTNLAGATLAKTGGSALSASTINLPFTSAGTINILAGLHLEFFSTFTQTGGSTALASGSSLIFFDTTDFQGGEVSGTGTLDGVVQNTGATLRPGGTGAAGTLSVSFDYTQGPSGTLAVEIGGTGAGQFDVLAVSGMATLGGTLTSTLINGFTPASGAMFQVVTAAPRTGTFSAVSGPFTPQYNSQNVTLLVPAAPTETVVTTTLDAVNANDGVVSLREAILFANANAGLDTITFNIDGSGAQTITVSSALPALAEAVIIDGYTQPGSSANTLAAGNNAVLNIVLAGASSTLGNGLTISASGVTVRGLVIQNFTDGIAVNGANAVIEGNWIGVNATGTATVRNADDGIQVGASNVTIGGTTPAARNLISGNGGSGIEMTGGFTGLNVQGNYIGTNAVGSAALANVGHGIHLLQGATNNTIGGTTAAARNVISGNLSRGVLILGDGNVVQGNYIGTNASGLGAVKNAFDGLTIAAPGSNNIIGGAAAGAGNVISGNDISGVTIESFTPLAAPATGNRVQGNLIGLAADGVTPLGNTRGTQNGWGVGFFRNATGNLIGGTAPGEGNTIAYNAGAGVAVLDVGPVGNRISGNSIFSNGDLGIDLGSFTDPANTALPNDVGDVDTGGNGRLNYPVLTSVSLTGSATNIAGTYNGAANATFTVEFFASPSGDPSGFGEGRTYLGSTSVTTDANGTGVFSFIAASLPDGTALTATAIDSSGNTSEFSEIRTLTMGSTFVVTTVLDVDNVEDGLTSLREAIISANRNPGLDTITFKIPGAGVQRISVTNQLPTITDSLVIDGYTQPGASPNTLAIGSNAALLIELNGGLAGLSAVGLELAAGGSTIRGLVINGFESSGILIDGSPGGNVIEGNFIGLNAAGTVAIPNDGSGIDLFDSPNNRFGGTTPASRNVISGNDNDALFIDGPTSIGNIIQGNYLGLNAAGTAAIPNDNDAIFISTGASQTIVGGTSPAARNVISGNNGYGVSFNMFSGQFPNNSDVQGNFIGTDATGTLAIPNSDGGISIFGSNNIRIGGIVAGARNVISGNGGGSGIDISGIESFGNLVAGNFVGVDVTGTIPLGNGRGFISPIDGGISLRDAPNNIIGSPGFPNVIVAHEGHGIVLSDPGTTGNLVQSNFIGVTPPDAGGSVAIPNAGAGIFITNGASGNDIGGTAVGNIIAGNTGDGVLIDNSDNNVIRGNRIGQTGVTSGVFPNGGAGVHVIGGSGTRIGSPATSELNIIANNLGEGILVQGSSANVTARGNIITNNGGLGLDLDEDGEGVSANDALDADGGPNTLLNFPTLTNITRTPVGGGFSYTANGTYSGAANTTVTIDFYANDAQDASGFGEGQFLINSFSVTTDGAGNATFSRTFTTGATNIFGSPLGSIFSSQATLGNGTSGPSSEFSAAVNVKTTGGGQQFIFDSQAFGSRVEIRKASNGELVRTFSAFNPAFKGGVRVASGDVNGDGFNDIITATGGGGGARVRVFDGLDLTAGRPPVLLDFYAFGNAYRGGLHVAAGDVNGDGKADIIVAPSAGSSGLVKVFSGANGNLLTSFMAFGRGAGGVRVAAGDVNGDGIADIITGTGAGSSVRVFDGANPSTILQEFRAFPSAYRGGVTVAAGDVDGDGRADIIVGAGSGSNAARIFLSGGDGGVVQFNAFGGTGRGINVAAVDVNADGIADIIAAQSRNAVPRIRIYDGASILDRAPSLVASRAAFTSVPGYVGGIFVA